MKKIVLNLIKLFGGLFVCALGIVMTINADLGLAPWDVFHEGLSIVVKTTMGRAHIMVGISLVILDSILGEKIGWGTLSNMLFVGLFIDFLMLNNLVPTFKAFLPNLIMMLLGLFVLGLGCHLYISVGLGSGPRDGLMVALIKRTKKPVWLIKSSLELIAVTVGYILGGKVGIGTLIMAIAGGYAMQLAFRVCKFDVEKVEHRFIDDDIKCIKEKLADKADK